ncbi:MAG: hypothetical protein HN609_08175 [Proteobacteria bacterium]|jgi:hypothetical protein|nr:hypothetical protein [Pseudomonadota bacterium]
MVKISEVPNEEISHRTREYVDGIFSLNSDPYFRDAVMRFALRELAWALLDRFDDKYTLGEQLRIMADLIEKHEDGT